MRHSSGLQISDLEAIPSGSEQELTIEEAEKIVGGFCPYFLDYPLPDPANPPSPLPPSPTLQS